MAGGRGHSSLRIPLLQETELLKQLKELACIDEKESGMVATGVLPHVYILKWNKEMKEQITELVKG